MSTMIDRFPAGAWQIGDFALIHVIMHNTSLEEAVEGSIGMDINAVLENHWAISASA